MNENPSRASGAVNELQELMTHVAGQSRDSQWQHPSDLTCRNYQKRFGNRRRTMTLSEWQDLNKPHYKRFLNVPRIFHRSHF
ncbi:S100P-binding protein-like [Cyprinodon tularosa]|uniref:S100P-binding protein-like n=1 Tax=Cyprinodon tularosa TaxID=77115 RepID=UPI0018E25CD3|nr:S100P-binding protein-like [Cyprinodon tularosa]